ncbi:uncharacterized protein LOC131193099 isoform X2 [Ahaetulla prasina]|nr:uncharacterized protein LOC131193099 isoform X2 [Ahaetulla prasina]XP_058028885.1 uncharacterized protein LOC131193099 isoform X2 [Ahaetulla prasina]XP_058028886.1 uncharacterized protein LOC131193099 isoform X2 [Ahaetulla prasina]
MEEDNLSNRGTLRSEQMPLRDEVTEVGLVDAKPISHSTSKRKRKSSFSGMNICENNLRSSGEHVEMVGCAEGPCNRSPERVQEKDKTACEPLGATTPSRLLPGPVLSPKKRKLILHIDLNNTILVSDAITKQDPSAALNCYLSTVTWGKLSHTGEWQWVSESPSLHPPCQGAVSFYSQYGRNTKFTETPCGKKFQDLHRQHLKLLEWQAQPHPQLSVKGEQARHYHLVLPSFFRLLESLHREGREFAVIFRTFGTDLPRVLRAVSCALEGQHPGFPALGGISLPVDLRLGKIRCSKKKVALSHGAEQLSSDDGCRKMYAYFSSREGISGFQDHFEWWAKNNYSSQGGKPIWVDPQDPRVQHICIDDNIRLTDSDTIVHPQVFLGQGGDSPQTIPTSELYDICLVQTDLLEAIADVNYFCHCIKRCEENYENYLSRVGACT